MNLDKLLELREDAVLMLAFIRGTDSTITWQKAAKAATRFLNNAAIFILPDSQKPPVFAVANVEGTAAFHLEQLVGKLPKSKDVPFGEDEAKAFPWLVILPMVVQLLLKWFTK